MATIKIHNAETGEVIEREMTDLELEKVEKFQSEVQERIQAQAEAKAKKALLLEKLGITEEEAQLLLS